VPLFVEELTKAVVETDVAEPRTAVPATLEASLLARLDRAGEAKEAAQIAACIGREFAHPLLATVWSSSPRELEDALERLVAAELIFRRGTVPDALYTFKHALVRDAAHESLLRSQRQALHRRIVEALEERFPETARHEPELLAHHCAEAGLVERAVDYRHLAGQLALGRCSMSEATTQLSEGLAILERLPDGPDRECRELALLVALGQASIATRGFAAPETGRLYARARELCLGLRDPPELMPILYGQSVFHMQRGQYTAAHDVAEELRLAAERHDDAMALVTAHRMMGSALTQLGRLDESRRQFETALRLHDPERHRNSGVIYAIDSRVMCLSWLSHVLHLSGEPGPALECHLEALSCARSLGHASSSVVALAWGCIYQQLRGDHELAGVRAREAITAADEHGFPLYRAAAVVVEGWARAQGGDYEAALARIVAGIGDYTATGAAMWLPYFLALKAELLARAGRPSEGLDCVREALERIDTTQGRWIEAELLRLQARLRAGSGPIGPTTLAGYLA
jgi:predicted ATPase